jgi:hypothetical protein
MESLEEKKKKEKGWTELDWLFFVSFFFFFLKMFFLSFFCFALCFADFGCVF